MANKGNITNDDGQARSGGGGGEGGGGGWSERLLLVRHTPCRFLIKPG